MSLSVIILAAGEGTRMRSDLPKVLHPLGGRSILEHVVVTAKQLDAGRIIVVYGHDGQCVRDELNALSVDWVEQQQQLGTGHAVAQAIDQVPKQDTVLVLYGDVPMITADTLQRLISTVDHDQMGLLTACLDNPKGYGRIVRDAQGHVTQIVEDKDAGPEQQTINEINTGILATHAESMQKWVTTLGNDNSQGEYYLTDIIAMAVAEGVKINTVAPQAVDEIKGINDRAQLAELERYYQGQQALRLMIEGITLRDPNRFDLRGDITFGKDVVIDVNAVLEGTIVLGDRVHIGPNTLLRNVTMGDDVTINANTVIDNAVVGNWCKIGPFSRIRPETQLDSGVHIGNFVEVKKSLIKEGSKINHLSYIGDTTVGRDVNIGAGTITCNYDGAHKHHTEIGDHVFIGSATQLVAPVTIGTGATIGAGSTITRDVPADELALSRVPQKSHSGWKRPKK